MPSLPHALIVDLLREQPHLVLGFLQAELGDRMPAYTLVRPGNADFTQLPPEFRADLVLVLYFGAEPVLAVIVEVQLARDDRKLWSWPVYVSVERSRCRCPASLVVVTLDEETAR